MSGHNSGIRQLIQNFKSTFDVYGWSRTNQQKSKILQCALVTLIMRYAEQWRAPGRSLQDIVAEVQTLPSFKSIEEKDIILTLLLFEFDRDLLLQSKKLIAHTWEMIDINSINDRFRNGPFVPQEREDAYGVSLVLSFEYPETLLGDLEKYLQPIHNALWTTPKHHFTIFNIGTEIRVRDVENVRTLVQKDLERQLRRDFELHNLAKSLQSAAVRPELYVMPDGSIILFGSGKFLESMHEFRLKLREQVLPMDLESILARDAQPVWTHTVFSRITDKILPDQIQKPPERLAGTGERINLKNAQISLMTFKDAKAMLSPEMTVVLDLQNGKNAS